MSGAQWVRGGLVAGYVAVAALGFWVDWQTRLFWTVLLPLLPLFIVVAGFSTWRRVCPLAFWGELGRRFNRGAQRRLPRALEGYVFAITFGVLLLMLVLRLVATNGDGRWLGALLIALAAAAVLTNRFFTGKTWCNYLCPVGLVEVIYTDAGALGSRGNSQCARCTACRKNCPDIDQENSYWKELENRWRRIAGFAFPGLVLGFYAFYWLRAGTWAAYFDGAWTARPFSTELVWGPGFFFAPFVPGVLAALATLVLFSAGAVALFALVERLARRWLPEAERRNHLMMALTSFCAFNAFYVFAGAPSLRLLPGAVPLAAFVAPVLSTAVFMLRWRRSREQFLQEKGAAKLVRSWPFEGVPPKDTAEVFAFYKAKSAAREQSLTAYRNTVREMLHEGLVGHHELRLLSRLRAELLVSDAEHEKVLAELSSDERRLLASPSDMAARLQELSYEKAITAALLHGASPGQLDGLRFEHGVDAEAHERVMARARSGDGELARRHRQLLEQAASQAEQALALDPVDDDAARFLAFALRQERLAVLERAAQLATPGAKVEPAAEAKPLSAADALAASLASPSPYQRAAALLLTSRRFRNRLGEGELSRSRTDPSELVREVAARLDESPQGGSTVIERIVALWRVSLFSSLEPALLHEVSGVVKEESYAGSQVLCREGEPADDMFVVTEGVISIQVGDREVAERGPGEVVGELAVIDGLARSATVRARSSTVRTLRIDGRAFRERLLPRPEISFKVLGTLAARLRER